MSLKERWGLSSAGEAFLKAFAIKRQAIKERHRRTEGEGVDTKKKVKVKITLSAENYEKMQEIKERGRLNGLTDEEVLKFIITTGREMEDNIVDDPTPTEGVYVGLSQEERNWLEYYRGTEGLPSIGEAISHIIQEKMAVQ